MADADQRSQRRREPRGCVRFLALGCEAQCFICCPIVTMSPKYLYHSVSTHVPGHLQLDGGMNYGWEIHLITQ